MAATRKRAHRTRSRARNAGRARDARARRADAGPRAAGGLGLLRGPHGCRGCRCSTSAQRDVLGLALVALGVFLGFVLYGGWDGGRAGHGLAVALGWMLGGARVLAPVALVVGGGALLLRPVLPALRPLRAGRHLPVRVVTLALAAGTLGLSSGPGSGRRLELGASADPRGSRRRGALPARPTGSCRASASTSSWSSCCSRA